MDEDIYSQNRLFQRRTSLTFPKPLGTRDSFHNRSLQDFSNRVKVTVEDELESHRRKQSVFNWSGLEKDMQARSPPQSSDSLNSDTVNDEWKQVISEQRIFHDIFVLKSEQHLLGPPWSTSQWKEGKQFHTPRALMTSKGSVTEADGLHCTD